MDHTSDWNPFSPRCWAGMLGLVHAPMFGLQTETPNDVAHSVLLDGHAASFALSISSENRFAFEQDPLSWAWSSNLRHSLVINDQSGDMYLRRWDAPEGSVRRFRVARNVAAAAELLQILQRSPAPQIDDVVLFVLRGFRFIRNALPSGDGLNAIRLLNIVLLGTERVRRGEIPIREWSRSRTVQEIVQHFDSLAPNICDVDQLPKNVLTSRLGEFLLDHFLSPEPVSQCTLNPELLLRHASGQLYQEAHLQLEHDARQLYFPGLAPDAPVHGILTRDVRFTPPSLARLLVQQALNALGDDRITGDQLEILDPACGSGVFLQESLRELVQRGYTGKVTLRGFDTSPISETITRFCLSRMAAEARGIQPVIDIRNEDSLRNDWGRPDLILMNPPFVPWDRLIPDDQDVVKEILGDIGRYRNDVAMAFIWKAAQTLYERDGTVLSSVLPAALFETQSGHLWRQALEADYQIRLLGRFEGYGYFRGSMVEPGLVVLQRKQSASARESSPVRIVIAKGGYEDDAIRGVRRNAERFNAPESWDVFSVHQASIAPASWMPRFRHAMQRVELLAAAEMTKVADLFQVRQGTLTGHNNAFVLSTEELNRLPKRERAYFRPIASNSTIHDGMISPDEFVFYPYDRSGPTIASEEELLKKVPRYFADWLNPNRTRLIARKKINLNRWWLLERHRNWQMRRTPKLASTYFGDRGSFAFDDKGDYVVLQGYGWIWRNRSAPIDSEKPSKQRMVAFEETPLPWAYLALLNSGVFEDLLESSCPRVQGGQFNLSARFVNRVYLPDLSNDLRVTGSLVEELANLGKRIHSGNMPDVEEIDHSAARAYGLPE